MITDYLAGLGMAALILIVLCIIIIPIIIGIVIAIAVANWLGVAGLLWWSIVILVALIIWAILGAIL